ncbi:GNAT family N-acetyltransferase [Roseibium sp. SCP14]|uniref:GNAT family N-acetyltransferase n=1 Tax=Roseibium sp. SCP14 TaxID=3141375 RepID=UPI0033399C3D
MVTLRVDPFPSSNELDALWLEAWGERAGRNFSQIPSRSLAHIGAYENDQLVGFVNVAWDGGIHAFILDTCVHPRVRRQGIATRLIAKATRIAQDRGALWLHVDFEPHLTSFYRTCGFEHTEAGLMRLSSQMNG